MNHLAQGKEDFCYAGKKGSLIILCLFLIAALTSTADAATTMKHEAPDYFVADQRIALEVQAKDPSGIQLVRCYFKAAGEADLVFVPMDMTGKNEYTGVLPAPSGSTTQIEYLFLAVNASKVIVRSQTFTITQNANEETPAWQEIPKEGEIKVSMELDKAPTELAGFSDNVTIDVVESGARFGVVALLYHHIRDSDSSDKAAAESAQSGTASGSAAGSASPATAAGAAASSSSVVASAAQATGATSAGVITAGAVGWSTAAIVGVGVGAAAVVGGTAAAVNASDDDNDDENGGGGGVIVTECNAATFPGGDTPETHSVDLGQQSGTFDFEYETYSQQDRMIVTYEGNVLFDTGCVGANGIQVLSYSGKSSNVTVEVIPNCAGGSGTAWEFTVNCPQ